MTQSSPDPSGGTASAAELGEWIGLSEPRIHALAREGVIPRMGKSRFDLKAAVREYRSDGEMARALAALDSEITAVTNGARASVIRFSTSKGL